MSEISESAASTGKAQVMGYVPFERKNQKLRVLEPRLTIRPSGRLSSNVRLTQTWKAAKVESVLVLWDEAKRSLLLKAVKRGTANAYAVTYYENNVQSTVSAAAFFNIIGWNAGGRSVTLPAKWDPKSRTIEAVLPKQYVHAVGTSLPLN